MQAFQRSSLDLRVAGRPRAPGGHNDPFADIAGGAKSPLESQNCTRFLNRPISTVLTPPLTCSPSHVRDLLHRRLRSLRYLHDRSDYYRPERTLPGGSTPHWEIAPFHGARQSRGRGVTVSERESFASPSREQLREIDLKK